MTPLAVSILPILIPAIVVVLVLVGFVGVRSRRRVRPAPPAERVAPPEAVAPPREVEAPAREVQAPPRVPEARAPEAPEIEAPPPPEPPPPVVAPRRRVRSIGASLARLFKGTALTEQEWEELEEVLLRADVGVAATQRV